MIRRGRKTQLPTGSRWQILILILAATILPGNAQSTSGLIASVVQRGNFLYVYNAKGSQLCAIAAGDGLAGYTGSSVSVKRGNFVYVFDAKGRQTSVIAAGR